jgi:hypothetical protein
VGGLSVVWALEIEITLLAFDNLAESKLEKRVTRNRCVTKNPSVFWIIMGVRALTASTSSTTAH